MRLGNCVRYGIVALAFGVVFQACGGLDPANITIVDEQGDAGMSSNVGGTDHTSAGTDNAGGNDSPTSAKGGEGGNATNEGGSAGETTTGGAGGEDAGDCVSGKSCLNGPDPGLCVQGACASCQDPGDDAGCKAAYGKGYLCIDGGCIKGDCHDDADCSGTTCINHVCAPCTADTDCTAANTICNTTSGVCVTSASCGGAKNGEACPANPRDLCCGAGTKCEAVQCCGAGPCRTNSTLKDPDGACDKGVCVRTGCPAPTAGSRAVDFEAEAGGNGSQTCPFNKLGPAVESLANSGGVVLVALGGESTTERDISVGSGITITGADENWQPCDPISCPAPAKWSRISTGDGRVFNMRTPGQRNVRYLQLQGLPNAEFQTATWAAIYVTAASVHVDHLEISGYQYGLYADTAGSISGGAGLHVHHCRSGLYLEDGAASAGGSADLEVTTGDDPITFDHNNFGFVVHGNSTFILSGPPAGRGLTSLVTANENGGSGVYYPAHNAKPGLIYGLEAAKNGTDPLLAQHDGATVFAHAIVKIRNSYFHDNVGSGIHVPGNGPNSADGLSGIDLGQNNGNNAGHNTFINNADAGICVEAKPALAATANSLKAQGNVFRASGGDCTAGGTYVRAYACEASGADYAGACAGSADLDGCAPSNTCQ